ncbi:MAG: class I SAM-dependent methyltransferase [Planctomycetaceae bacterium]|nr:class I SAM-dependent methyltransferase [Planctomycetaceae bacterium]
MRPHWLRPSIANLERYVLTVRDFDGLTKAMSWDNYPLLDGHDHLKRFDYLEDLNDRRWHDAQVVAGACRNADAHTLVEIGTGLGYMTAIMAPNAPTATVHTINIPPENIGKGGSKTTFAPKRAEVWSYYREQGCKNVVQLFENTAIWQPTLGPIDVAFIDGCHDAKFVFNDTKKILSQCRTGSIVFWHDFSPSKAKHYDWIDSVCRGVNRLYRSGIIRGRILHLQDSWIGLYVVQKGEGGAG